MIVLHVLFGIALVAGQETAKSTLEGVSMGKAYAYGRPMAKSNSLDRPIQKYSPEESTPAEPKKIRSSLEEVKKENPKEAEETKSIPAVETAKYNPPTGDISKKSDDISKSKSNQKLQSVPGNIVGSMYEHEVKYGDLSPVTRTHVVDPYKDIISPIRKPKSRLYPEYRNPYFTPREEVELKHRLHAYSADRALGPHRGHHQRQPKRRPHTLRRSRNRAPRKSYGTIHHDYAGIPLFPEVSGGLGYI